MIVKNRLSEVLKEKGVSQYELAKRINRTSQQVWVWSKNRHSISLPNLKLISNALNCTIDDLVDVKCEL